MTNRHIQGLVQERGISIANALELRLSCTNPSIFEEQMNQLRERDTGEDEPHGDTGVLLYQCPGRNGRNLADDIFKCTFMKEKFCISIQISLKFVPKVPIDNKPALV